MSRTHSLIAALVAALSCAATVVATEGDANPAPAGKTHRVPADFGTIQAAVDAAANGDTVLVTPGTYHETVRIAGKTLRLVSEYTLAGDEKVIRATILDGRIKSADGETGVRDQLILVEDNVGPETEIVGFTIRNGDDGITNYARIRIAHNYFTANEDAIDNEGGGGLIEHNVFAKNLDDAVDFDLDSAGVVANNRMLDNDDDGIEMRLHDYHGETLNVVFRDNIIAGNGEDGIQIIDYPGLSDRKIRIEGNVIARNAMSGIGLMSDGITVEDYRGADIPEPIEVVNNTIVENEYGITGGDNLVAVNNVIAWNKQLGLKNVDGRSLASHNLVWANGTDFDEANVRAEHIVLKDPQLDKDWRPAAGSPCINAGVAELEGPSVRIEIVREKVYGSAPDIGAFEFESDTKGN